jgi:hypothetical protein
MYSIVRRSLHVTTPCQLHAAQKSQFGVTTTVTKGTVTDAPNDGSARGHRG